ncbi:(3R)-hydroxymyristoyl ACP dehydratase [Oceanobacter sp. RED65]|uniref:3-hydroxyacyl-[acyl-carrier-protein] dehydratase FabZ n=2 Tax=Bermanella marisrubri TaxID=207949 RepID=Q1N1W3_9GAMM|nr:(3R)-hydroxymyristoyl ACP dehydratase [Oceanobacter sp. RED65] [Bermanella marisrubri]
MTTMDYQRITDLLPHRYPFLLVDRVTELETKQRIVGYKNVSSNEPFFQGHFPKHPIMPGVLILESLAQLAGLLGLDAIDREKAENTVYYFAGVDTARFKKPVIPGDRLDMEARYVNDKRGIWRFECEAKVDGKLACQAEILCAEREIKL